MKRLLCVILACVLLCGCSPEVNQQTKLYEATFLDVFDTITVIKGNADSKETFQSISESIHEELTFYHQMFDIYNDYEGLHNLKTVNDQAGIVPVKVDPRIIDLLLDCKSYYDLTDGKVNVAMGSVLQVWHETREDGMNNPLAAELPADSALQEASLHTAIDAIVIDEEASTVYISDPAVRLDVGAVAKGWAAQRVAETAPKGMLLSIGGNICATGPKNDEGTPWVVGVQNPDGDDYLHTIYVSSGSVVTSGDYQRYYTVNGIRYHHIIDPQTLYPSAYWRSVTIVCEDSGIADALSTALFLLPLEEGMDLLDRCGAEAVWVGADGNLHYSSGFEALIRT